MNDNDFDHALRQSLRSVTIPDQLKTELLQIASRSANNSPTATPGNDLFSTWRYLRTGSLAAAVLGLIGLICWWTWGTSYSGAIADRTLPKTTGLPANSPASSPQPPDLSLVELNDLDRQLDALKKEYQQLEIAEQTIRIQFLDQLGDEEIKYVADEYWASIFFSTAETNVVAHTSTPSVLEQLHFVIETFPQTRSAVDAQHLLPQIQQPRHP